MIQTNYPLVNINNIQFDTISLNTMSKNLPAYDYCTLLILLLLTCCFTNNRMLVLLLWSNNIIESK